MVNVEKEEYQFCHFLFDGFCLYSFNYLQYKVLCRNLLKPFVHLVKVSLVATGLYNLLPPN